MQTLSHGLMVHMMRTRLVWLLGIVVFSWPTWALAASPTAKVSTTLTTDQRKIRQFVFDGSLNTFFRSTKVASKEDHLTLQFSEAVTVSAISVLSGEPNGNDVLTDAVLEGSADGKTFKPLATFNRGIAQAEPKTTLRAIRLAFPNETKTPVIIREMVLHSEPHVTTFHYPIEIFPDASEVPDMANWLTEVAQLCEQHYPMICRELRSDGYRPPTWITMTLRKDENGVAYASGNRIVGSAKFFAAHPDDKGAFIHETAHCVQQYRGRANPGWLVEGVADYVRFFKYEPKKPKPLTPERAKYDGSYRTTAAFLEYLAAKDAAIILKLNAAMRRGEYTPDLWKELTGKTVEELGRDWQSSLAK